MRDNVGDRFENARLCPSDRPNSAATRSRPLGVTQPWDTQPPELAQTKPDVVVHTVLSRAAGDDQRGSAVHAGPLQGQHEGSPQGLLPASLGADKHRHVEARPCLQRGRVHQRERAGRNVVGIEPLQRRVKDDHRLSGKSNAGSVAGCVRYSLPNWMVVMAWLGGTLAAPVMMRKRMAASVLRLAKGKPGSELLDRSLLLYWLSNDAINCQLQ